jgi:hypothetical protein
MNPFYNDIEDGVRPFVKELRDIGINTISSCGHEGWIECDTIDHQSDFYKIKHKLHDMNIPDFKIDLCYWSCSNMMRITIKSVSFIASLTNNREDRG